MNRAVIAVAGKASEAESATYEISLATKGRTLELVRASGKSADLARETKLNTPSLFWFDISEGWH
jgi:hypothetical protein